MTRMTLYTGGGVSLSPENGEGRTVSEYIRLAADSGKILTDGNRKTPCVDVIASDAEHWSEIDDDPTDEVDADRAMEILFGGEE